MERVTVIYPNKADANFDFVYYMKKHIPFVEGLVGKKIEVRRGISSAAGSPAAFVCIATIPVDSLAAFQTIFAHDGARSSPTFRNTLTSSPSCSLTRS